MEGLRLVFFILMVGFNVMAFGFVTVTIVVTFKFTKINLILHE